MLPAGAIPIDPSMPYDSATWEQALVADDDLLAALRVGDDIREELADVGVVVLTNRNTGLDVEGDVTVGLPDGRSVPGVALPHRYTPGYISSILMTGEVAADLGLELVPSATLFRAPAPLTGAQRGALEDLQYDLQDGQAVTGYTSLQWDYQDSGPTPFQLELILSGVALVFALFVVGVSLALAAAESKDERDILTIAGAPPGTLARSAGARAWLLAVIGTAMAVPVGFLPVMVFSWASGQQDDSALDFPIVFPTRTVLLLLVAVPLIVAGVSWSSSSMAQRLRPVRVSTATFE